MYAVFQNSMSNWHWNGLIAILCPLQKAVEPSFPSILCTVLPFAFESQFNHQWFPQPIETKSMRQLSNRYSQWMSARIHAIQLNCFAHIHPLLRGWIQRMAYCVAQHSKWCIQGFYLIAFLQMSLCIYSCNINVILNLFQVFLFSSSRILNI